MSFKTASTECIYDELNTNWMTWVDVGVFWRSSRKGYSGGILTPIFCSFRCSEKLFDPHKNVKKHVENTAPRSLTPADTTVDVTPTSPVHSKVFLYTILKSYTTLCCNVLCETLHLTLNTLSSLSKGTTLGKYKPFSMHTANIIPPKYQYESTSPLKVQICRSFFSPRTTIFFASISPFA